jgi:hypothetical protein
MHLIPLYFLNCSLELADVVYEVTSFLSQQI